MVLQESLAQAQDEATQVLNLVTETLGKSDVRWSADEGIAQIADLVVMLPIAPASVIWSYCHAPTVMAEEPRLKPSSKPHFLKVTRRFW